MSREEDEIRRKMAAAGFPMKEGTTISTDSGAVTVPSSLTFEQQEILKHVQQTSATVYKAEIECAGGCGESYKKEGATPKEVMDWIIELFEEGEAMSQWKMVGGKPYCEDCQP